MTFENEVEKQEVYIANKEKFSLSISSFEHHFKIMHYKNVKSLKKDELKEV